MAKYPPSQSESLQTKADSEFENVEFESASGTCVPCQFAPAKSTGPAENEKVTCGFGGVELIKQGREFSYQWTEGGGVERDAIEDGQQVFEIIAGDKVGSKVVVKKNDMIGPCANKHAEITWDIEWDKVLDHMYNEIVYLSRPFEMTELGYYWAYSTEPRRRTVKSMMCSGSHSVSVVCYPDTKLTLEGKFLLAELNLNRDAHYKDESESGTKRSGNLDISLERNGEKEFTYNLFSAESSSTYKNVRNPGEKEEIHAKAQALKMENLSGDTTDSQRKENDRRIQFLEDRYSSLKNLQNWGIVLFRLEEEHGSSAKVK